MLRVFLSRAPQSDRPDAWVQSTDGRAATVGRDVPARWPADPETEVVLASDQVRLIMLAMPAMPRDRMYAAVRYALEDQLATPVDEASIAVAGGERGAVLVAVASAELVHAIAAHGRGLRRIIPESALAPHDSGWTWCVSGAGGGFVRRADGSAFSVGGNAESDPGLPVGLAAALAQAAHAGAAPSVVNVAFPCDASQLAKWSESSGLPFVATAAWHWKRATPNAFAGAPDFLDVSRHPPVSKTPAVSNGLRPALLLAALAAILYVGGLALQWSFLQFDNWQLSQGIVDAAAGARITGVATASEAISAIARRNTELRHVAGQSASADALPLLARAATTLGALPPGTLRSARYGSDAWTFELGKLDATSLSRMTRALASNGIEALAAPTAAGTRMRLSLSATAR